MLWGLGAVQPCMETRGFRWNGTLAPSYRSQRRKWSIILACQEWGSSWGGLQVVCHSDNQSVIADLRSRTSKHKGMMHLLHSLMFVEVHLQCYLYPIYIDAKANHLADCLSHNNVRLFLSKVLSISCRSLNSAAGPATGPAGLFGHSDQGADIIVGVTCIDVCPVTALCPRFAHYGFHSRAVLLDAEGKITKSVFVHRIRDLLQPGFQAHRYVGHSFQIGAATTAALVGMVDSMIQTLGRWHSVAFLRYIRSPKARLASTYVTWCSRQEPLSMMFCVHSYLVHPMLSWLRTHTTCLSF